MRAEWIWLADGERTENERGCFVREFSLASVPERCEIRIAAVTRYKLYCNGQLVGYGPMRSSRDVHFFDTYGLEALLRPGENLLAVHVWNYGWSTYQSLGDEGGLCFEVAADGAALFGSDAAVRARRDAGHMPFAPKRNANLGFTDYYDARNFDADWMREARISADWPAAAPSAREGRFAPRPIPGYHRVRQYPRHLLQIEDAAQGCQVISVNTRHAFYGDRRDADESLLNGLIGCVVDAPRAMSGRISFPNRTWNGMLGTFRVGEAVYPVTDRGRDVAVELPAGKSLFLIQLSGKFDDLYCHVEFRFPEKIGFEGLGGDRCFFVVGPTRELRCDISGRGRIYDEMDGLDEQVRRFFGCATLAQLEKSGAQIRWVEARYVMPDMYLLSMARLADVRQVYQPTQDNLGILWDNDCASVVELPECGDHRRLLLDFGDMYVGNLEFTLRAPEGAILDIYCFENMYRGEIDFTIGLNNGMRYICREGWQHYCAFARMGMRYAIVSVREASGPVMIRDFHVNHATFASANLGSFQCDDYKLNHIWKMCEHTHRLCLEDSFTDSPTYEQTFWLGDAQTSAAFNAYLFGDYALMRRCLVLAADAQQNTPLCNALAPTDWGTSIPMWTMNWFISLQQYVEHSGDAGVVRELYGPMRDVLLYYRSLLTDEGGFLVSAWNLIDWAPLDLPASCVPAAYQGMLSYCFEKFADMADTLGRRDDAALFRQEARRTREYLDRVLWDGERQAYRDGWSPEGGFSRTFSLQTHMLLYLYGAVADDRRKLVEGYLLRRPEDFIDAGSPFILFYLYECWAMAGALDKIFEDIRERWGEMARYESTTCWEVFPGFYENSRTRSYCHSWSAAPAMLMQKYLLGIRRDSDGFADVSFHFPQTQLRWCRGAIPTPHGAIRVDWNKDIGLYRLQIPEAIRLHGEPPEGFEVTIEYTK